MTLSKFPEIRYAISTVSDGNMSLLRDDKRVVLQNRQKFLKKSGLDLKDIVTTNLVHGSNIQEVTKEDLGDADQNGSNHIEADGLITNQPNVNLFILIADCHAIALYDPKQKATGLIHAGRPGLMENILTKAVQKMHQKFNIDPKDLIAQFSPSIGPCCYKPAFPEKSPTIVRQHIVKDKKGEYALDIQTWAENQLKEAGIKPENITNPQICNYHHQEYFSYRRSENLHDPKSNGRFAVLLGLF